MRALIREIATDGVTVLVSSHLLAEVEQICTHVGVMRTGRLVFQGTLEAMRARGAARVQVRTTETGPGGGVAHQARAHRHPAADGEVSAQIGDHVPEVCAGSLSWPVYRWPGSARPGPAWRTCSWN